jgi:Protein of unknown function (DUF2852)
MPLVFFGFFVMMMVWLLWAIAWVVVAATVMLAWPIALVLAGSALWRVFRRRSQRAHDMRVGTPREASHNSAFEEYRQETLRRLDEEGGKFREFLERMRKARDRKEFDAYMAARRGRPAIIEGSVSAG